MQLRKKRPEEVFTPRSSLVNEEMYVDRGSLEDRLKDALAGKKYVVIHGESGNGKTWLYKKVLNEEGFVFEVVSLSNAVEYGSLSDVFDDKLGNLNFIEQSQEELETQGSLAPAGVGFSAKSRTTNLRQAKSSFVKLVAEVRSRAGKKRAAIALDNFEQILDDPKLLSQLRALIISADDDDVAIHRVNIILIGVPGNLKELISKTPGAGPIINRLTEIPEVARIPKFDAGKLIEKGLFKILGYRSKGVNKDKIIRDIVFFTDCIAQQIHELCLAVAQAAERNDRIIDDDVIIDGITNWTQESLSGDWAIIEGAMNAKSSRVGRKNQVLFSLARCKDEEFRTADVEAVLRKEFEVGSEKLNVSAILSGFAKLSNPILKRTPKENGWRFVHPKLKTAIRIGMKKVDGVTVEKASFIKEMV